MDTEARDFTVPSDSANGPFRPASVVLVWLRDPREKFWGAVLALTPAGLSLRGIDLQCLEDAAALVKRGDSFSPSALFFPMHRVERIELDASTGGLPSLAQRFAEKSGVDPVPILTEAALPDRPPRNGV